VGRSGLALIDGTGDASGRLEWKELAGMDGTHEVGLNWLGRKDWTRLD
jgi:hypothetical protein